MSLAVLLAVVQMMMPMTPLDRGRMTQVDAARQVVVRTPDAWASLWREHAPGRPAPAVDFAHDMVVGVFLGSRPTAGWAVEIVGVREDGGALVVEYREVRPKPGTILAQVMTYPYHLVSVPTRLGDVRFTRLEP